MREQRNTGLIKDTLIEILAAHHPMTVRQAYYQLVSRQIITNNRCSYISTSRHLVSLRKEGAVPWGWIEDRIRRPRQVGMWDGLEGFGRTAIEAYRRDVWQSQDRLVELWVEKDALSGIFEDIATYYGMTVNVGRGYDGWGSVHLAAQRYSEWTEAIVLYFGDFDPSGMDISRSLNDRLGYFETSIELERCALTKDDVIRYRLPFDPAKVSDTRSAAFVERYGDMAVELDALPVELLQERIRQEIEGRIDLNALAEVLAVEKEERERLREIFE